MGTLLRGRIRDPHAGEVDMERGIEAYMTSWARDVEVHVGGLKGSLQNEEREDV